MTSKTARSLSNVLLFVALVLLALDFVALFGKLPRIREPRDLWLFAFVFLVGARILRRQGTRPAPAPPPTATQ